MFLYQRVCPFPKSNIWKKIHKPNRNHHTLLPETTREHKEEQRSMRSTDIQTQSPKRTRHHEANKCWIGLRMWDVWFIVKMLMRGFLGSFRTQCFKVWGHMYEDLVMWCWIGLRMRDVWFFMKVLMRGFLESCRTRCFKVWEHGYEDPVVWCCISLWIQDVWFFVKVLLRGFFGSYMTRCFKVWGCFSLRLAATKSSFRS